MVLPRLQKKTKRKTTREVKSNQMTDFSKYRNISLDHDTYKKLEKLSKSVAPIPMSMSKTLLILINLLKKRGKIK